MKTNAKRFVNGRLTAAQLDTETRAYVLEALRHDLPIMERMASGGGIVANGALVRVRRQITELEQETP